MAIPGQIELAKEPDFTGKSDPDPKLPLSSIQVEHGGTGNKSWFDGGYFLQVLQIETMKLSEGNLIKC